MIEKFTCDRSKGESEFLDRHTKTRSLPIEGFLGSWQSEASHPEAAAQLVGLATVPGHGQAIEGGLLSYGVVTKVVAQN